MEKVRMLATGDVHSPRYLPLYKAALLEVPRDCDLVLWAGDMVLKGHVERLGEVLEATRKRLGDVPILAVFGNEEYWGLEDRFREEYPEILWLDDEYRVLTVGGVRIAVVGTRGALDRPTTWQRKHRPELVDIYRRRPRIVSSLVSRARREADIVVLLSHYATTYKTLEGEPRRIWPELGSRGMEEAVKTSRPDLVVHAHAHNSRRLEARVDGVPVYNVSLPANKRLVLLEASKRVTLAEFLG